MLKERAKHYYLNPDTKYNCSEALFLAANDVYELNADEDIKNASGAFGGGAFCGRMCGACAGSVMALGLRHSQGLAVNSEAMKDKIESFMNEYINTLGSDLCVDLKDKYFTEENRCGKIIELSAEVLEKYM